MIVWNKALIKTGLCEVLLSWQRQGLHPTTFISKVLDYRVPQNLVLNTADSSFLMCFIYSSFTRVARNSAENKALILISKRLNKLTFTLLLLPSDTVAG